MALAGRTVVVTGGSRGIGLAIAKRAAADGANIVLGAKTVVADPKLPGTIYTAADECITAGGAAIGVPCDLRNDDDIAKLMEAAVSEFGGIDVLINNASAIDNSGTLAVKPKKYALMHGINARGTFFASQAALPHLLLSSHGGHVLNMSPPLSLDPRWFKIGGTAYTVSAAPQPQTLPGS